MGTIEKTISILEAVIKFAPYEGFSISDLSNETGLTLSTVHRICSILTKKGYLYQKHKRMRYTLGYKFLIFNNVYQNTSGLKDQALPLLKQLCKETSETIDLVIFDGLYINSIATVLPDQVLQAVPDKVNVQPWPLHGTSTGKILLAYLPDDVFESTVSKLELVAYTHNTITDKGMLINETERIRNDIIAYDNEEFLVGVLSIAVPIKDEGNRVLGAVSIVGPSTRLDMLKLKQLAPKVRKCALQISHLLGYHD